ncbi:MAG: tetratricopeptide repeat protein [Dongiaceae bacterium]
MRRAILAGCLLAGVLAMPARADMDRGMAAYERGDFQTAYRELRGPAAQGNPQAQAKLGYMYMTGKGVKLDYGAAMRWLSQAADVNEPSAQTNIGVLYYEGDGVDRDYKVAAGWFQKAADQGDADAQARLGTLYTYGFGLPKDYSKAYFWFALAAKGGNREAVQARDSVASVMRPSDVAAAKKLAEAWKAKPVY